MENRIWMRHSWALTTMAARIALLSWVDPIIIAAGYEPRVVVLSIRPGMNARSTISPFGGPTVFTPNAATFLNQAVIAISSC